MNFQLSKTSKIIKIGALVMENDAIEHGDCMLGIGLGLSQNLMQFNVTFNDMKIRTLNFSKLQKLSKSVQ